MTGNYELWTPAEDAQLRQLFEVERKTKAQIAEIMPGRTYAAIDARTQNRGFKYQGLLSAWTTERDALLRQLWVSGLSAGQIVKHMPGYTRNAIIGRVTRLGLSSASRAEATRAQQNIKPIATRRPSRPRNMIRFGCGSIPKSSVPVAPPEPAPALEPIAFDLVTLDDRRPDQCGWPVNEGNPFLFCGAVKSGHKRYCDRHAMTGVGGRRVA